jgi:hypothetical protein
MQTKFKTDFLVARPSFASGFARLFDWYGQFDSYNESTTEVEADGKAILSDWSMVGLDILSAVDQFDKQNKCDATESF